MAVGAVAEHSIATACGTDVKWEAVVWMAVSLIDWRSVLSCSATFATVEGAFACCLVWEICST